MARCNHEYKCLKCGKRTHLDPDKSASRRKAGAELGWERQLARWGEETILPGETGAGIEDWHYKYVLGRLACVSPDGTRWVSVAQLVANRAGVPYSVTL